MGIIGCIKKIIWKSKIKDNKLFVYEKHITGTEHPIYQKNRP